jgi:hypothetical protein
MHALLILKAISFKIVNYIAKQKPTSALKLLILLDIVRGGGKAYNQMNGGSANGDAFVD